MECVCSVLRDASNARGRVADGVQRGATQTLERGGSRDQGAQQQWRGDRGGIEETARRDPASPHHPQLLGRVCVEVHLFRQASSHASPPPLFITLFSSR